MFGGGYDQTNQSHGLILHPNCPFDYTVSITRWYFPSTTQTCSVHTTSQLGLLCGHCKESYSLVLSTSQCVDNSMQCSNNYLALIIIFVLMGVALVFMLLVCKLTVATGTLSGLVFNANIVGVNRNIFLPVESTDTYSVFIT